MIYIKPWPASTYFYTVVMNSLFLIFNHRLTRVQKDDARASLGVGRIIDLPTDLKKNWCQIPPDLPAINNYLAPIKTWLSEKASHSDYVLIQGDLGACYIMVDFAFDKGLIPIYSTSHRNAVEEHKPDGSVQLIHHFEHRLFREYGL